MIVFAIVTPDGKVTLNPPPMVRILAVFTVIWYVTELSYAIKLVIAAEIPIKEPGVVTTKPFELS